ncbi:MAG: NAD(P)H-hydrate epimerase [Cereibacter sphaeroides]|uniref:Bifunctional NAD(P)H-hydrate repair enzyme n=1 Tax=Cereibacter sphaeroides TaxID=1063 RepID=A0A2W5SCI8_CERSP|nr:MAG: NAD(P)H-hydrate epimerase [Cereibacter sphaeroides]
MTELLTSAQMRAIEREAIGSGRVSGLELMERAGRGVVEAIFEEWPELRAGTFRAVVLCGPGNNGGDGFVVARLLKEWGWGVEVYLYGDAEKLPPDAQANHDRWIGMGEVLQLEVLNASVDVRPGLTVDLIVDALFGIGLTRTLPDAVTEVFCYYFRGYLDGRLVAVDVPSGLCADSGRPLVPQGTKPDLWPALMGMVAEATLTVTFHRAKPGHFLDVGPRHCGRLVVKDIGLVQAHMPKAIGQVEAASYLRDVGKSSTEHKFTHGHALVLSGPSGRCGAARLAARGALRIGAGVVTVGCPPEAIPENAARLDAVMLREVTDAVALQSLLEDRRINALCIGPGLGTGAREAALVGVALGLSAGRPLTPPLVGEGGRSGQGAAPDDPSLPLLRVGGGQGRGTCRIVIDADALTILSQYPDLFAALHPACVLTPHAAEFARLFPDIVEKLHAPAAAGPAYSKVDATREAARRAGCTVLFKGPDTVIADPSGQCSVNAAVYDRAAPWLATAGSGDVLAGFITGLMARGFDPMRAAETAAWLHVECARQFGPGLIAEDLPEQLPGVFRSLSL